jgi:hypothetical protein
MALCLLTIAWTIISEFYVDFELGITPTQGKAFSATLLQPTMVDNSTAVRRQ